MDTQQIVKRLLPIAKAALIQKAGARHSMGDNDMIQRMHDLACELGAKCKTITDGTRNKAND